MSKHKDSKILKVFHIIFFGIVIRVSSPYKGCFKLLGFLMNKFYISHWFVCVFWHLGTIKYDIHEIFFVHDLFPIVEIFLGNHHKLTSLRNHPNK